MPDFIVLTLDAFPDPRRGSWVAYHGDATGCGRSIRDAMAALFKRHGVDRPIDDIRILTGQAADEYVVIHGDASIAPKPLGILNA